MSCTRSGFQEVAARALGAAHRSALSFIGLTLPHLHQSTGENNDVIAVLGKYGSPLGISKRAMNVSFEPTPRARGVQSEMLCRIVFSAQRFLGHRLAYRIGRLFTSYENARRDDTEKISPLFVRMPGVYVKPGSGRLIFEGGAYLDNDVQVSVTDGTIRLGDGCRVQVGAVITSSNRSEVSIGRRSAIGPYSVLYARARLTIGTNVMVGPKCSIIAETHGTAQSDVPYQDQPLSALGVTIEDNVWLGAHVCVLDGVTIGTGSVVSAGASVIRNIPPYSLVAGVPGRVIRSLRRDDRQGEPLQASL